MRITIDLDREKAVATGTTAELNSLRTKRATLAVLEVQFVRNFEVVELPNDATGKFELKKTGRYDEDPLTGAAAWLKFGSGTDTYYLFAFALINDALDALFGVDPAPVAFTANATTNLLTTVAPHGLAADMKLRVESDDTLPAPLDPDLEYFASATGLTTTDFKVSLTAGGPTIDLLDAGTGTHSFVRLIADEDQLTLMGEVSWRYDARDRKSQTFVILVDNDVNRDADTIPDSPAIVYMRDSLWRYDDGPPDNSLGLDGDGYVNTLAGAGFLDFYARDGGVYTLIGNLKGATGAAGADGRTILYGTAAPTSEGANGDFYIRTTTNFIYGPKAAGSWPAGTSLVGPTGATGPGYLATSATSLLIATGSKVFTTQAGLAYSVGARVRASSAADPLDYMEGLVASYSGTTLTVTVDLIGGSGTDADWKINLAGNPGIDGTDGDTTYPASVAVPAGATANIDWSLLTTATERTLAANSTFTHTNTVDGKVVIIPILNTGSNYTVAWVGVDHWQGTGGATPTQSIGAVRDVWTFARCGSKVYGFWAPGI